MIIEVQGLGKRFASRMILRGLDFQIQRGEIVALAGPNGAGKTTFLRILASLVRPNAGTLRIMNMPLPDYSLEARAKIGYLAHQTLLYPDLSAEENLRFFGRLFFLENLDKRLSEILELVGLTRRRRDPVRIFSRGMQQRLAIGRSILHDPDILLLDEAHTGLDQEGIESLNELLMAQANSGKAIVMASHDLDIVAEFANRVDVLVKGRFSASLQGNDLKASRLIKKYRELTAVDTQRGDQAMKTLIAIFTIVRKDFAIERRSRQMLSAMLIFSLLVVLIFNFALELDARARISASAGILWATFAFAGTLGLNRSMALEVENKSMDGLLTAPIERSAIYFGKFLANLSFMLIVEAITLPIYSILYNINLLVPGLLLVIFLGSIGYAAVGTLLTTMAAQTRTRDLLLPILLFPIVIPLLVAAVRASSGYLNGSPAEFIIPSLNLLIVFDVVMVALGYMFIDFIIEE